MKSKGFSSIVTKDIDNHSGESLWRKYRDIKAFVINEISDIYASCMPPPSGISMEEIFIKTRYKFIFLFNYRLINLVVTLCTTNVTPFYQLGRKLLFQRLEEKKKEKVSKKKANELNKEGDVVELKQFDEKWFPTEWAVFLTYGIASSKPESAFFIE